MAKEQTSPDLRLVWDARECEVTLQDIHIVAAPRDRPPFDVDALVVEQDTWLVLDADTKIVEPVENVGKLVDEMEQSQAAPPGSIRIRSGTPLKLDAVVHDFEHEPTWTEAWIISALGAVFTLTENSGMKSLGLPLLGCQHGNLEPRRFFSLLRCVLSNQTPRLIEHLWLVLEPKSDCTIIKSLVEH
ncbi:MAG: hypothetical protein BMS9Abin15_1061 [Gammaproteobacteria bacterium]|nr:MAG: hypothetical protein BMS9Abin15_1061 [Gammaproteobacteria bacterium]